MAVSLVHGYGLLHALLSYPLGGMLAIMAFVVLTLGRQDVSRL